MDEHTLNLARACCAMDLVGDLSSARLRDELVSLLDEEKVDFALRRVEELGVWPAIHGRLRVDAATRASWCAAPTSCARRTGSSARPPRWRLRLVWLLRDLDPEEIAAWTVRMRVRAPGRRGARAGARRRPAAARPRRARPSEAELYDLAAGEPLEAVLAAMTLDDSGIAADRLAHFLDVTRHVRLEIGGADLLAMGFTSGPRIGEVLRSVLHLKLNGVVDEQGRGARRGGPDAGDRVTDTGPAPPVPRRLAAADRQPRAARARPRVGRVQARRPDRQGARTAHAQPAQAPRHVGHHHAGGHVPRVGRQLLLRLGQAGAGRPALLQGRAARHGVGRRGGAAHQLRPRAGRRRPASGSTYTWSLFVAPDVLDALRAERDPRDAQPDPDPAAGRVARGRRVPAARDLPHWAELDRYGNYVFIGLFAASWSRSRASSTPPSAGCWTCS